LLKPDDCPIDSQKTTAIGGVYSFSNNDCNWDTADGKFQLTKWKMKGELHNRQWKEKAGSVVRCLLWAASAR
jgi:hypothetical protein